MCEYDTLVDQAVWAIGNIAGDSTSLRDLVLASGAFMPVLAQLEGSPKMAMMRTATWTLSVREWCLPYLEGAERPWCRGSVGCMSGGVC